MQGQKQGRGLCCLRSTDEAYIALWGRELYELKYIKGAGVESIWLCPTAADRVMHIRHCMLAVEARPGVSGSFLDDTFLIDRRSTIREYLAAQGRGTPLPVPVDPRFYPQHVCPHAFFIAHRADDDDARPASRSATGRVRHFSSRRLNQKSTIRHQRKP